MGVIDSLANYEKILNKLDCAGDHSGDGDGLESLGDRPLR